MRRKAPSSKTSSKKVSGKRSSAKKSVIQPRPTPAELYAAGKKLREKVPRTSHAAWKPPRNRPDPLQLMQESNKGRIPELIPIRHGRMLRTPFTFYRGAALNMAADLGDPSDRPACAGLR